MESLFERVLFVQDVEKELLWRIEENGGHAENAGLDGIRKTSIDTYLQWVILYEKRSSSESWDRFRFGHGRGFRANIPGWTIRVHPYSGLAPC